MVTKFSLLKGIQEKVTHYLACFQESNFENVNESLLLCSYYQIKKKQLWSSEKLGKF